jgi:hypothetical protein
MKKEEGEKKVTAEKSKESSLKKNESVAKPKMVQAP